MLQTSFDHAAKTLSHTHKPCDASVEAHKVCESYIMDAPENQRLERFQEIVDAHVNTWKETISNFVKAHQQKTEQIIDAAPELMYLKQDLESTVSDIRKAGNAIPYGSITQDYNAAGINFWSIKKQEVSQLFNLVESVPEPDKEEALLYLEKAGQDVGTAMLKVSDIEDELLKLARPLAPHDQDFQTKVIGILNRNAPYHRSVGEDWTKLSEAAHIAARPL